MTEESKVITTLATITETGESQEDQRTKFEKFRYVSDKIKVLAKRIRSDTRQIKQILVKERRKGPEACLNGDYEGCHKDLKGLLKKLSEEERRLKQEMRSSHSLTSLPTHPEVS